MLRARREPTLDQLDRACGGRHVTDVVMIGGGGHAMSCLDAVDPALLRVVGYVSPAADPALPLEHLGGDDSLTGLLRTVPVAFVAVGDNGARSRLCGQVQELGFELATVVAPTAHVSPTATVGPGTAVLHRAVVGPRSRIGRGVVVNTAASVDHDCIVGDFAHIAPGSHLAGGVRFGAGTFAGVGVSIIPDVHIEDWAVIGAGAVVVDSVEAGTTVVGVPARTRRRS